MAEQEVKKLTTVVSDEDGGRVGVLVLFSTDPRYRLLRLTVKEEDRDQQLDKQDRAALEAGVTCYYPEDLVGD